MAVPFSTLLDLVIMQNGKRWLLSGCAHNGILNILDRYKALFGSETDCVISGSHMMKRDGEHTGEEKTLSSGQLITLHSDEQIHF